jgi:hypothetical protein
MSGSWQTYTDPQSGRQFPVWEGNYAYPGSDLSFIPTWAGGMFEALMANEVVPETSWGPHSFGLADVRTVQVHHVRDRGAALPGLGHLAVQHGRRQWWLRRLRRRGPRLSLLRWRRGREPPERGALAVPWLRHRGRRDPARLVPRARRCASADANISALRSHYSGVYGVDGFFDAVNPTTGAVGHRYLVLDHSMIMAALDNALNNRALQRYFAADPASWAARTYLGLSRRCRSARGPQHLAGSRPFETRMTGPLHAGSPF